MKATKMTLIAALAVGSLLALSPASLAQDSTNTPPAGASHAGGHGMHGGPSFEQIATTLALTDDQKPKVKTILDSQMQKMRDLRQDPDFANLSREDKMAKMKSIHDDITTQLKPILTPEQFDKWEKMGPGMRNHRKSDSSSDSSTNAPAAAPKN